MKQLPYRFEKYISADFPVYMSNPIDKKNLISGHYHRDAEINQVLSGSVQFRVGTAVHLLHAGDIIFFGPYVMHEAKSETEDASIRGFIFDTSILGEIVDLTSAPDSFYLLDTNHPQYEEANMLFEVMHTTYSECSPTFRLRIKAYLMLFSSILQENGFLLSDNDTRNVKRTAPVISYIKENYAHELSIKELASIMNVCNDTLIRVFKSENGQTPFSYIMNLRICEALKLLSEGKHSISEIASRTGFSSSSYFIKIFKEKLGSSPSKYQKEHFGF